MDSDKEDSESDQDTMADYQPLSPPTTASSPAVETPATPPADDQPEAVEAMTMPPFYLCQCRNSLYIVSSSHSQLFLLVNYRHADTNKRLKPNVVNTSYNTGLPLKFTIKFGHCDHKQPCNTSVTYIIPLEFPILQCETFTLTFWAVHGDHCSKPAEDCSDCNHSKLQRAFLALSAPTDGQWWTSDYDFSKGVESNIEYGRRSESGVNTDTTRLA